MSKIGKSLKTNNVLKQEINHDSLIYMVHSLVLHKRYAKNRYEISKLKFEKN